VTTIATNPYLQGNYAPQLEELTATDLRVTGSLPTELTGRYARIGPNPIRPESAYHWFIGDGMVHGLRLREGKAEWFRSRYIRSDDVTAHFGTPETPGPRHGMGGNTANTNVIHHAGATYAIVEAGGLPVQLTDEFETVARSNFGGTLPGSFTAHPKRDRKTGELHAMAYYWEWPYVQYLVVGVDGKVNRVEQIDCPGGPMMHDFALTDDHVVIFDLPCTFSMDAVAQGAVFPYRWNPEHPARVGLMPRSGTGADVRWSDVSPCFVYHPMNAYDLGDGRVVVDVPRHAKTFATDLNGPNEGGTTLERWTIDPAAGKVLEELVDDQSQEFPRVDERLLGREHRYGYAVGFDAADELSFGSVVKHDFRTGAVERRGDADRFAYAELVFVPRSTSSAEDDGWLMGYRYDREHDTSELVVLSAQDVTGDPVALVHLPRRVPHGFHGNWLPDA
jgi:carotenoid cleavage dioxygenase-like enzyme